MLPARLSARPSIRAVSPTLAVLTALALLATACGGDSGDPTATSAATESNSTPATGAPTTAATADEPADGPSEDTIPAEEWVADFCVAYATWDAQAFPSDGIDPTTLDLEERIERANQSVQTITSATDDFVDFLFEENSPGALDGYRLELLDDAEFLLWDMEDFVDDPAENLQDLDDISVTLNVRVGVLRNTTANQTNALPAEELALVDANPDCGAVPRSIAG